MKYVDIINNEGAFNLTGDNESVITNITSIHPELVLEDNSMLIFENINGYYEIITDADIVTPVDQDINLENLMSTIVNSDTVSNFSYNGYDVTAIYEIEYRNNKIYYIQRNGINPLSE